VHLWLQFVLLNLLTLHAKTMPQFGTRCMVGAERALFSSSHSKTYLKLFHFVLYFPVSVFFCFELFHFSFVFVLLDFPLQLPFLLTGITLGVSDRLSLVCMLIGGSMVHWLRQRTCDLSSAGSSPGHDTAWLFVR